LRKRLTSEENVAELNQPIEQQILTNEENVVDFSADVGCCEEPDQARDVVEQRNERSCRMRKGKRK